MYEPFGNHKIEGKSTHCRPNILQQVIPQQSKTFSQILPKIKEIACLGWSNSKKQRQL